MRIVLQRAPSNHAMERTATRLVSTRSVATISSMFAASLPVAVAHLVLVRPMTPEVRAVLDRVRESCDFGYVPFEDINDTNEFGSNALHCIAVWGDAESARVLISAGINVNQPGEDGYTPLHTAASFGHYELVKLLLESGANPLARTDGYLPFTIARLSKQDAICDLISEYMQKLPPDKPALLRQAHMSQLTEQIEDLKAYIEHECDDKA